MAIHKIGGIILSDRKFLAVTKKESDFLITPGGKIEIGETPRQCLERELKEELNVKLVFMKPLATFKDKMQDEKEDLILETYFAEIDGEPTPNSEIEQLFWINSNFKHPKVKFSKLTKNYIVPKLLEMKLID